MSHSNAGCGLLKKRRSQLLAVCRRESIWRYEWSIDISDATSRSRLRLTWSIRARVGLYNHKKAQEAQRHKPLRRCSGVLQNDSPRITLKTPVSLVPLVPFCGYV